MKITETKMIPQEVRIGYKCDSCGMEANGSLPSNWHSFSSSHSSWGNDSHESMEWFHVCSPACFKRIVEKEVSRLDGEISPEISEMSLPFIKSLLQICTA